MFLDTELAGAVPVPCTSVLKKTAKLQNPALLATSPHMVATVNKVCEVKVPEIPGSLVPHLTKPGIKIDGNAVLPVGASLPAFANHKISGAGETDRIAVRAGLEVDISSRLVVLVVVLAASEVMGSDLEIGQIQSWGQFRSRGSQGASDRCGRNRKIGKGNHSVRVGAVRSGS